jgi:hypothetical protein
LWDPTVAILALGNEMEDAECQGISEALSAALGALHDVVVPSCQVQHVGTPTLAPFPGHF